MKFFLTIVNCLWFIILFILLNTNVNAQLSGTISIPGGYPTIAAAIADINLMGVGPGGVTFNVAAGHSETFSSPLAGSITASGTDLNPIIFQKSGVGVNPLITSGLGTNASSTTITAFGDGIIIIEGGDYITFDGIDLQENPVAAGNEKMEFGYFLKKASGDDACKNVTIKNCTITLDKVTRYSWGIYVSNFVGTTSVTVTSVGGRSENIKIFNNNISNVYGGIQLRGFLAATPFDLYDQNIEIGVDGANTITDFGGGSTTVYAIYSIYANDLKIANNTINGGNGTTTTLYGIATSAGTNSNVDINNNTVTIEGGGLGSTIYAINNGMGATGTNNTVNIYDNIVENCTYPTATTGGMYLVYNSASAFNVNIYGNIVRNNSKPGTLGAMYLLYNNSTGINGFANIYNNTIHGNTNGAATGDLFCLYSNEVTAPTKMIYGNTIYNNTGGDDVYGINTGAGVLVHVYGNNIYDITTTTALTTTPYCSGITIGSGTEVYVYNNFISDLKAPNSGNTNAVIGINSSVPSTNSTLSLYYNSIYLNASGGTTFGSSGISVTGNATGTTGNLTMNNNLIINLSTPGATSGLTTAYRRSNVNLANYNDASDYNNFYVGTTAANRVLFSDGTNTAETLIAMQTLLSPNESNSISKQVFYDDVAVGDLHLTGASVGDLDLAGVPIVGITTDIDDEVRDATFPYMGADEGNIPLPVELSLFTATVKGRDVNINWSTATEVMNYGFEVQRASTKLSTGSAFSEQLSEESWEKIGFVEGHGNSNSVKEYVYTDINLSTGKYSYRLKQIDNDGTYSYSNIVEVEVELPKTYSLSQNYPNPFNPTTQIDYQIPYDSKVTVELYSITGERVAVLVNDLQEAGYYSLLLNSSENSLVSGIYLYRIIASAETNKNNFILTKKMILLK